MVASASPLGAEGAGGFEAALPVLPKRCAQYPALPGLGPASAGGSAAGRAGGALGGDTGPAACGGVAGGCAAGGWGAGG
jgi:hypothetical protein